MEKALSKNPYHTETSQLIQHANQSTGIYTTRVPNGKGFRNRNYNLFGKSPHTKARQLARNANQSNGLEATQARQDISEETILIIVFKFSGPKTEPVLAKIYVIKLQYMQKVINARTNNVKRFLQY